VVQVALPQMMEQATPEQRHLLERVQSFAGRLAAAQREGKDLRPVVPFLQKLLAAGKEQDPQKGERLLDQAEAALKAAKPLPRGAGSPPGPGEPPGPGRPP